MVMIKLPTNPKVVQDSAAPAGWVCVTGHSQDGFTRGNSYLTYFPFMTRSPFLVDREASCDLLDFSKAFDTISHSLLLDNMCSIQLDKHIHNTIGEQVADVMGWAQNIIVNAVTLGC